MTAPQLSRTESQAIRVYRRRPEAKLTCTQVARYAGVETFEAWRALNALCRRGLVEIPEMTPPTSHIGARYLFAVTPAGCDWLRATFPESGIEDVGTEGEVSHDG